MKKLLIFMLLMISMSLFANLTFDIGFETDVVGEGDENGRFTSPFFNITNEGEEAEYTIGMNVYDSPEGWFMTWCHEDLSGSGLSENCHHFSQPWTFNYPANTILATDFQVNGIAEEEGMISFEFVITGGDLAEPILLPFTFRTVDYVPNDNNSVAPNVAALSNYPNPFNPETTISFTLNKDSQVKVEVFNILGQHITTLLNEYQTSGTHTVVWNGKDKNNNDLSSGIYFYKLISDNHTKTNKMILLK